MWSIGALIARRVGHASLVRGTGRQALWLGGAGYSVAADRGEDGGAAFIAQLSCGGDGRVKHVTFGSDGAVQLQGGDDRAVQAHRVGFDGAKDDAGD